MKKLSTGVTTFESQINGITQIQVNDPIYLECRFITKNEFNFLLSMLKHLIDPETLDLSFDLNGYKCIIKNKIVKEVFINGQEIYLKSKELKKINCLYMK